MAHRRSTGKKASVYTWRAPDGSLVVRHTFQFTAKEVKAYPYKVRDQWRIQLCDDSWSLDREPVMATRER